MINCYETSRGDFVPPHALTADEALALHRRGVLEAGDYGLLTLDARLAVAASAEGAVAARRRRGGCGVTIFWGVRTPTRAYQGRA